MQVKAHYRVANGKKVKVGAHSRSSTRHKHAGAGAKYRKMKAMRMKDGKDNAMRKSLGIAV